MTAIVKIVDDHGNPTGTYELSPSSIFDDGISTKYVFAFEFNVMNALTSEKHKTESEDKDG